MDTVSDNIVRELLKYGIDTYFLVTGGAIVPFVDAVGRNPLTQHYCFQHEQAAAMAAEGYYRASNKVACVLVTSGPGVQNILNGVCGCWYDSIPALFISGQVNVNESADSIKSRPRQVGFQEFPVEETFAACTKFCKKIRSAEDIGSTFRIAMHQMLSGRKGPVLIDFPVNFQMGRSDCSFYEKIPDIVYPSHRGIRDILELRKRPVIVIGNGCRSSINSVKAWIEKSNIPFVTSWGGCDLIEYNHHLRIGNIGVYGDRIANYTLQNADVVIILGSRMDTRQTGGNLSLCAREAIKIMVDIDEEEIGKLTERGFKVDVPIVSSVTDFIDNNVTTVFGDEWIRLIRKVQLSIGNESMRKPGDIYDILSGIDLPPECIIIPDTGGNLVWSIQALQLKSGHTLFSSFGNSSMGYSLPASIGAAIATDKKIPVICICGDGGIQMNVQEFHTVSTLKLPITIIIVNNSGYGIIRQFQDQYFNSRYIATSENEVFGDNGVHITDISRAYGIPAVVTNKDITISSTEPILYDLVIDPSQKIYPKVEFGNALENMYPYRDDIESMMIIASCGPPIVATNWIIK